MNEQAFAVVLALARSGIAHESPSVAYLHQVKRLANIDDLNGKQQTAIMELLDWHNDGRKPGMVAIAPSSPLLPQQGGEQTDLTDGLSETKGRLRYPAAVLPQVGEAVAYRYRVLVDKHITGPALEGEFEFRGIKGKSSGWMLSAEFPDDDFLLEVIPLAPAILGEAKAVARVRVHADGYQEWTDIDAGSLETGVHALYAAAVAEALPVAAEKDAKDKITDTDRLNFMLENDAFVCRETRDDTFIRYVLQAQDEDENYHTLSGEFKSFANEREAIDAAIAAMQGEKTS